MWVSLRSYHGPVEFGWDGLMSGGMYCEGGNRIRCTDPEECMSIDGSHTSQLAIVEPNDDVGGLTKFSLGE